MVMAVVASMMRAEPRLLQGFRRGKLSSGRRVFKFRRELLKLARLGGIALGGGSVGLILELRRDPRSDLLEQSGVLLLDLLEHAQEAGCRGNALRIGRRLCLAGRDGFADVRLIALPGCKVTGSKLERALMIMSIGMHIHNLSEAKENKRPMT
jgi:hypothetical protein